MQLNVPCRHWKALTPSSPRGECALQLYGGQPARSLCMTVCAHGPRLSPETFDQLVSHQANEKPLPLAQCLAPPLRSDSPPASPQPPQLTGSDKQRVNIWGAFKRQTAFLILSGPSFTQLDHEPLRRPGLLTMAVNNAAAVFRPDLWVSVDAPDRFLLSVWRDPRIMKFVRAPHFGKPLFDSGRWRWSGYQTQDCPNTWFWPCNDKFEANRFLNERSINWGNSADRGGGRSVMLPALRILFHLGVSEVFLLGCDFRMEAEYRYSFDEQRTRGAIRTNQKTYRRLNEYFDELRPIFEYHGFRVWNCNRESQLRSFDFLPYDEAIDRARHILGAGEPSLEKTHSLYAAKPGAPPTRVVPAEWRHHRPDVALVSWTSDRPERFAILEQLVARQTFQGKIQWIVIDDGATKAQLNLGQSAIHLEPVQGSAVATRLGVKIQMLLETDSIVADKILLLHEDAYYRADYIEAMLKRLDRCSMVGLRQLLHYDLGTRMFRRLGNRRFSLLQQTGLRRKKLVQLWKAAEGRTEVPLAARLWQGANDAELLTPDDRDRQLSCLLALNGSILSNPVTVNRKADPELAVLQSWLGNDIAAYDGSDTGVLALGGPLSPSASAGPDASQPASGADSLAAASWRLRDASLRRVLLHVLSTIAEVGNEHPLIIHVAPPACDTTDDYLALRSVLEEFARLTLGRAVAATIAQLSRGVAGTEAEVDLLVMSGSEKTGTELLFRLKPNHILVVDDSDSHADAQHLIDALEASGFGSVSRTIGRPSHAIVTSNLTLAQPIG